MLSLDEKKSKCMLPSVKEMGGDWVFKLILFNLIYLFKLGIYIFGQNILFEKEKINILLIYLKILVVSLFYFPHICQPH